MYPRNDIDKLQERGETGAVDPELREALDGLAEDLRAEIRSGDAETLPTLIRRPSKRAGTSMW